MEDEESFEELCLNLKKVSPHFFGRVSIVVNIGSGPTSWHITPQTLEQIAQLYDVVIMYCNFQNQESLVATVHRVLKGLEQSMQWTSPISPLTLKTTDTLFIPQTKIEKSN